MADRFYAGARITVRQRNDGYKTYLLDAKGERKRTNGRCKTLADMRGVAIIHQRSDLIVARDSVQFGQYALGVTAT